MPAKSLAQHFQDLDPVVQRHVHVENEQVEFASAGEVNRTVAIRRRCDRVPQRLEVVVDELIAQQVVFRDEDASAGHAGVSALGNSSVNVLPAPIRLRTVTVPPIRPAKRRLRGNPRPVPPTSFVRSSMICLNSSKMTSWLAMSTPMPVSVTSIRTRPSSLLPRIVTVPPSGVNLMALDARLIITCVKLRRSASTYRPSIGPASRATLASAAAGANASSVSCVTAWTLTASSFKSTFPALTFEMSNTSLISSRRCCPLDAM